MVKYVKAAKRSSLRKVRDNKRDIHYSPPEGDYEHMPFDYSLGGADYQGMISDKWGNQYGAEASVQESDTGQIAGGTVDYVVQITYNGAKIRLSDYHAIFDSHRGPGQSLISDIEQGMYLEDYLRKHRQFISSISGDADSKAEVQAIINDESEYDDRTESQQKKDKRNESVFVVLPHYHRTPFYVYNNKLYTAFDTQFRKAVYTGVRNELYDIYNNGYVDIPANTEIKICDTYREAIFKYLTANAIGITLDDLQNTTLELYPSFNVVLEYTKGVLKQIYPKNIDRVRNGDVSVYYFTDMNGVPCEALEDLATQVKLDAHDLGYYGVGTLWNVYKQIRTRSKGTKEATVTIEYDYKTHKYRAVGNDGINGRNFVQFPNDLREPDAKYKVDKLIWNGKNYRVSGNIERIDDGE